MSKSFDRFDSLMLLMTFLTTVISCCYLAFHVLEPRQTKSTWYVQIDEFNDAAKHLTKQDRDSYIKDLFNARLKVYQDSLSDFQSFLYTYMAFMLAAAILLIKKGADVPMPGTGISISGVWGLVLLPIFLTYGWIRLGFSYDHLLDDRQALDIISNYFQTGIFNLNIKTQNQDDLARLFTFGQDRILRDGGLVDGYFEAFATPDYFQNFLNDQAIVKWIYIFVMTGIFGTAHGLIYSCLLVYEKLRAHTRLKKILITVQLFFTLVFLVGTHYMFRYEGLWYNTFQEYVLGWGFIIMFGIYIRFCLEKKKGKSVRPIHK